MPAISSFVVVVVNIWLVSHVHVQGYKMNDGQVEWVQRKKNVLLWVFVETKGLPTEYIHKEMHWNVQQSLQSLRWQMKMLVEKIQ